MFSASPHAAGTHFGRAEDVLKLLRNVVSRALTRGTSSLRGHRGGPSLQPAEPVSEGRLGCKTETGQAGVAMGDEILSEPPTKK